MSMMLMSLRVGEVDYNRWVLGDEKMFFLFL